MASQSKLAGLGLLTAIASSLCCIVPLLAVVAGTSGLASSFSWLEPLRPYLIAFTVLVLGFSWYQKLKPQKQVNHNCCATDKNHCADVKTPFIQSKTFLGIMTIFAGLMLAFPNFAHIFYPKSDKQSITVAVPNAKKAEFTIVGMTCSGCEDHVNLEVNKLEGIVNSTVSYEKGNAIIEFDNTKTNIQEIEKAIANTGYSVTDKKEL